jgi:glycine hydroxymethyltransferase
MEVLLAVCKPGDTIMGLDLSNGGHLTHGAPVSATGIVFKSVQYKVKPDGYLDMEGVRKMAMENKPKLIWVGLTAYVRPLPFKQFQEIADECGAYLAADIAHISGLVIGGVHESPVDYVDIVTTTTHKTLRGPRGALIMVTEKGLRKDKDLPSKIDKAVFPGMQGGPHDHVTAGIAIALQEAARPEFKTYAEQVVKNSKALANSLMKNGVKLVTNGTDNHIVLADLTTISPGVGVFAQDALDAAGITMNKNTIPGEPSSPFYPSGLRMGTPAITTRGMKEPEMEMIGEFISRVIKSIGTPVLPSDKEERIAYLKKFREDLKKNKTVKRVRKEVATLCKKFPLYPDMKV